MTRDALTSFRERIDQRFSRLTKSEQRISAYLLHNYEEAAFLSAAEVAKRLEVSEPTVVRLATALGYQGYPHLRRELQRILQEKISHLAQFRHGLERGGNEANVLEKVIALEIEHLTEALRTVSSEAFQEAVRLIDDAKRLFIWGIGPATSLAEMVEFHLRRFGLDVVAIKSSGREVCEHLLHMTSEDAFLLMLFDAPTDVIRDVLIFVGQCGCPRILLTDTLGMAGENLVDLVLFTRRSPFSMFHSLVTPMAILDALILAVAQVEKGRSLQMLSKLDEIRRFCHFPPEGV